MEILSDDDLQQLTTQVAHDLLKQKWLLSIAESCTGGWVAKCCTDLAGSSAWFDRGFVTYSNQAKHDLLGVNMETLKQYGAVSEQVVIEMAQGALQNANANISASISGVAGPDGGTDEKPVGTVWLAWATEKSAKAELHHFSGNRDAVRRQAVAAALKGIIKNARD
ncbi:MAG: nicotinamide-nucleotide amidase [Methylophaga sp.]|nr:nicotinamide-nucleotide amidase [Methylophaga sp.]